MKSSILAVVAAVLLAVPASAYAQDKDNDTSTQQTPVSQSSRTRSNDSANYSRASPALPAAAYRSCPGAAQAVRCRTSLETANIRDRGSAIITDPVHRSPREFGRNDFSDGFQRRRHFRLAIQSAVVLIPLHRTTFD